MIMQALTGPGASLLTLPRRVSLGVCILCGVTAGPALAFGLHPGHIGASEIATLVISATFACTTVLLIVLTSVVSRLEDSFDSLPWKREEGSNKLCPFTGPSHGLCAWHLGHERCDQLCYDGQS